MIATDEEFITVDDIAERLKLNRNQVRDRLVKSKGFPLPFVFVGSKRWLSSDFEKWIEQCHGAKAPRRGAENYKKKQASI